MLLFCVYIYKVYAACVHFPTDNKKSLLYLKRFVRCEFEAMIANSLSSFRLFTLLENTMY